MSFWQFLRNWFVSAFHRSWETGHIVHQLMVLASGLLLVRSAYLGIHSFSHEGGGPEMSSVAPFAAAVGVLLASLVWYAYRLYRVEYNRRVAAEERMRPVLEITGIGPMTGNHYRIRVRNLSRGRIRFRTRLEEIRPDVGYAPPVPLRPTHGQSHGEAEAEVPGDAIQNVDVFVDPGPSHPLELLVMGNPALPHEIPRDRRYELRICVYPAVDGAVSVCRWFYIVPQPNGGVIFTADGSGEAVSPAGPSTG
jgi:hypothetical protein